MQCHEATGGYMLVVALLLAGALTAQAQESHFNDAADAPADGGPLDGNVLLPSRSLQQRMPGPNPIGIIDPVFPPKEWRVRPWIAFPIIWLLFPKRYDIMYINDLPADNRYRNLFILAVQRMQAVSGLYSFGSIADIHGVATSYNSTCNPSCCPGTCKAGRGYCPHGSPHFGVWHRPYLWQYELGLLDAANYVANSFVNATEQAAYLAIAKNLRVPFLNPAAGYTNNASFTIMSDATLLVDDPSTPETTLVSITNPLLSYAGSTRSATWKSSLAASAVTFRNQWTNFITSSIFDCTHKASGLCPVTNLESTHDTIHGTIGGSMGSVPTAAKDPIFQMHHCNVDRMLQAWQGYNPGVWMPATTEPATAGNFYYPPSASIDATSVLAPFYVNGPNLTDGNNAKTMHNNLFLKNRYSYITLSVNNTSGRKLLQQRDNPDLVNRKLAAEVLNELNPRDGYNGFRLQYEIEGLVINTTFCLHFLLDKDPQSFIKQYTTPRGVLLELMEATPQYCGVYCTFLDPTMTEPMLTKVITDITNCIIKQQIRIPNPPKQTPWKGPPRNPVTLNNITLFATTIPGNENDLPQDVTEKIEIKGRRVLGWWRLLRGAVGRAQVAQTVEESIRTGNPTRFVAPSRKLGVLLPGVSQGASDLAE